MAPIKMNSVPLPEFLKNKRTGKPLAKSTMRRKLKALGKQLGYQKVVVQFKD